MDDGKYRERKYKGKVYGRYVGIEELQMYTSLGQTSAENLGKKSGARKKVGKRVIYDLDLIDKYIEEQA